MRPLLFEIPIPFLDLVIPVHTYGFMIALGFMVAITIIRRLSQSGGMEVEKTVDLAFWSLIVGFLGTRVLYIITQFDTYMADPAAMLRFWEGGLVFYGGPLAVIPFVVWYVRKHGLPVWKTFDVFAPGLAVGQAFGRLGCLGAGCCYGKPTGSDWGLVLHSELVEVAWRGRVALHPTQIYSSVSLFTLLAGLLWVHSKKKFDGQVMLTYLFCYPIIRSIIENFRGDKVRIENLWGMPLSTSQFISILVVIGAGLTLVHRMRTLKEAK